MTLTSLESMVRDLTFQASTDTGLFTTTTLDTHIQIAHREIWNYIAHVSPSTLAVVSSDKSITSSGLSFTGDASGGYIYYAPTQLDSGATGRIRLKVLSSISTRYFVQLAAHKGTIAGDLYTPFFVDGTLVDDGVRISNSPGTVDVSEYFSPSLAAASVYVESLDSISSYPDSDVTENPQWHFDTGGQTDMGGVNAIVKVELKQSTGSEYTLLDPMDTTEIGDTSSSSSALSESNAIYRWYAIGETIYLHPKPTGTETIRVTYVPCPTDIASGTSPFGGKLIPHHHIIAYRAADLICTKDDNKSKFSQTYAEMKKDLTDQIRRRHVTHARRVRMSPWED
jgi:hypothetical protein